MAEILLLHAIAALTDHVIRLRTAIDAPPAQLADMERLLVESQQEAEKLAQSLIERTRRRLCDRPAGAERHTVDSEQADAARWAAQQGR